MTTGTDIIRQKIIAANKKNNLARFQQECGLTTTTFNDFIAGKAIPSATVLQTMTKWLWPNATFDTEKNVLIAGGNNKAAVPKAVLAPGYVARNPELVGKPPNNFSHTGFKGMPNAALGIRPGWAD